jgi:putative heme-binding domain-containing protein
MSDNEVHEAVNGLLNEPSPRVRFQFALSAGEMRPMWAALRLADILEKDAGDPWTVTAALSSASGCGFELLGALTAKGKKPNAVIVSRLAAMIGAKGDPKEIARVLQLVADGSTADAALLDGLGQGMRGSKSPLPMWWATPPAEAEAAMATLRKRFDAAVATVRDEKADSAARVTAANLLAYGPFDAAGAALADALAPTTPGDVQLAAVKALAVHTDPKVGELLLKGWSGYGPALRREATEAMLSRADRVLALLDALEAKKVPAADLSQTQIQQLQAHPNAKVKAKAATLFKRTDADRAKVVKEYAAVLELKGDAAKGKLVFAKSCAACHKLDGVGNDVGANLLAALPNKSGEDLLSAVFDPNREVDPRYVSYQAVTVDDRVLTGVVATETPTSITLRRADGKEDVILRSNLATLRSTGLSLMPVGLEKELKPQDVADLFAYLRIAGK